MKESWSFAKKCEKIIEKNGLNFFILYLKVAAIVILSYLGKIPLSTTVQLKIKVGLTNGLPAFLPKRWRALIRSRSLPHMRWILSMVALYRSMRSLYDLPDFSKIGAPPWKGEIPESFWAFCEYMMRSRKRFFTRKKLIPNWESSSEAWSNSSGPNGRPAWEHRGKDLLGLRASGMWFTINDYLCQLLGYHTPDGAEDLQALDDAVYRAEFSLGEADKTRSEFGRYTPYPTGKLSLKYEAASKIRIFAIVDWWTQCLFAPLHKAMEKVLATFPQDATFDQDGKTAEFAKRGYERYWSFDLSSATDMIPQQLYLPMMAVLLGSLTVAKLWLKILTDRDFHFTRRPRKGEVLTNEEVYQRHRYTRGQPMGAKSSWPALALVHHMIVLYCAWLAGYDPRYYTAYLVLGDDVVIADEKVANQYLEFCEKFEIPIGLAKSFAGAHGFFQFANQNWLNGDNISAVSLKADLSAMKPLGAIEFIRQTLLKWPSAKKGIITRFIRALVDDGQYASVVHDMKRWRFGATGSSIVRTLLTPGSPAAGLLGGDKGASNYLWLASISRGLSISEVNELTKENECDSRYAAIKETPPSKLDAEIASAQAASWISDLMGSMLRTRQEIEYYDDEYTDEWGEGSWSADDKALGVEALQDELRRLSTELFSVILPYLNVIRSSATYGDLVASFEFIRLWLDGLPHLMTFEARKGEAPSPWRTAVLPKALSQDVLFVLKEHGIRIRRVPASLITRQAALERAEAKARGLKTSISSASTKTKEK